MSILHRDGRVITNIALRLMYSFYKYLQFPRYGKIFLLVQKIKVRGQYKSNRNSKEQSLTGKHRDRTRLFTETEASNFVLALLQRRIARRLRTEAFASDESQDLVDLFWVQVPASILNGFEQNKRHTVVASPGSLGLHLPLANALDSSHSMKLVRRNLRLQVLDI